MWMKRRTPAAVAAARTLRVPPVLTRYSSAPPFRSSGMATRWRTASTPSKSGPSEAGIGDVGDPRLDAVAPGGRQAVADDGAGFGGAHHRHDAMIGAEQGRDGPAADEAARARDQDGGHARGIVASTDDDPPPTPGRGDAEGRAPPAPRRVAPRRDRPRARPHPRRRRAARLDRDVAGAHRADALRRPGAAPRGVRPADRAHAGRRGARADHPRAGRDQGGRERPLHGDPLGPAAPRRRRHAARGRDRGGLRRAPRRPRPGPDRSSGSSAPRCARTTPPRTSSSPRPRSASATRA